MYPRRCHNCSREYNDKSNYSRHKRTGVCERRTEKASTSIVNNNQNNGVINTTNNINLTINGDSSTINLGGTLQDALQDAIATKNFSSKETQALGLLKDVFDKASVTQKEHLEAMIQYCQTSCNEILAAKEDSDMHKEVAADIIRAFVQKGISVKDDSDDKPQIDMRPRELITLLAERLWITYFLPPLEDEVLNKLISRSVRLDHVSKDLCEIRDFIVLDKDGTRMSFERFCKKYKLNVETEERAEERKMKQMMGLYMDDDETYEARQTYHKECKKQAIWVKEQIDVFISRTIERISYMICDVIVARSTDFPLLLRDHVHNFAMSITANDGSNCIYVPIATIKKLKKALIDDNENAYVRGWRIIYEKLQTQNDVAGNRTMHYGQLDNRP